MFMMGLVITDYALRFWNHLICEDQEADSSYYLSFIFFPEFIICDASKLNKSFVEQYQI